MKRLKHLIALAFILLASNVWAEPYLAVQTGNKCMACHANPIGGGMRNSFGAFYGANMLPEETNPSSTDFDIGAITEFFRVGGDLRANVDNESPKDEDDSRGFQVQSGQLYFLISPKNVPVSLYLDQQVAPGGTLNRESYVKLDFDSGHYLKAGKLMLPYGLRLEDDSAFIRQASQVTFDNSDNGVELGLEFPNSTLNLTVANGTSSLTNDDDAFQYGARYEYIQSGWRAGSSLMFNDAESGTRTMYNVFGGLRYGDLSFLAEIDFIEDESIENIPGEPETILAGLVEMNAKLAQGYNLKLTSEFLDPDDNIDEDEQTRHSLLFEYTPFAHLQFRTGVRLNEGIPQSSEQNKTSAFAQLHMYF